MSPEILAISIPIIFFIGLFSVIALNIITKFKTKALIANRVESIEEWYKTEAKAQIVKAEARAARRHGMALRICGLVIGIGLGVTIGLMIITCGGFSSVGVHDYFDPIAVAALTTISLSIMCGGAGMIGAYFLTRRLEGKSKEK